MEVGWNVEIVSGVRQLHIPRWAAFVGLNKHQQFSEDFAQVAAVYLIDDQHIVSARIVKRSLAEIAKETSPERESTSVRRSISLNKIFIRVSLVKLDELNARSVFGLQ